MPHAGVSVDIKRELGQQVHAGDGFWSEYTGAQIPQMHTLCKHTATATDSEYADFYVNEALHCTASLEFRMLSVENFMSSLTEKNMNFYEAEPLGVQRIWLLPP